MRSIERDRFNNASIKAGILSGRLAVWAGDADLLWQEAEQPVGRLARLRGCADDGAVIFPQHLKPRGDVVGVPHSRHDAERGAAEGCVDLGPLSEQSSCLSGLSSAETSRSGGVARF